MSITIEGAAAPAGFVERLLERAAEHPEEFGLSRAVGNEDFTWQEVALVVDHEGVTDGVIDERDRTAFVDDGRTSRGAFNRLVASMSRGLGTGLEGYVVRLDTALASEVAPVEEYRCEELGRMSSRLGVQFLNGNTEVAYSDFLIGWEYLTSGCLVE